MVDILQGYGFTILTALVMVIVCIIGALLIEVLKRTFKKLGLESEQIIFDQICDIVDTVVSSTNQTIVDNMKKRNDDNKLTEEQQKEVFDSVLKMITLCLSTEQSELLESKYVSVENGLTHLIEKSVHYS